jgi:phospholipid/cholesterol/gamma-HCH transport system substrate-binding protein
MARTTFGDRRAVVRASGIVAIVLVLALVWLTYAVFTKQFVRSVSATVASDDVGLELSKNADVKLRGVIVGRVSAITSDGDGAEIHLALDRDIAGAIPAQVEAYIVPKTLFGEKYVDLRPVASAGGNAITAGARIPQGAIPPEVERLLNDAYPLLTAIEPEKLSYLLTALSEAFSGQGKSLGKTLTTLEEYLVKLAPLSDDIVADIKALGQVATAYGDAMPEIGDLLSNAVVTGDTLVAKQDQLTKLFSNVDALSDTTDDFLRKNGDNLVTLAVESRSTLDLLAKYSPTLPCVLGGIANLLPRIDDAFRDQRAHVSITFSPRTPTGYTSDEHVTQPGLDAGLSPDCRSLPASSYSPQNPAPAVPPDLLAQFGISNHNVATPGSTSERKGVSKLLAGALGLEETRVPDIASQLALPALRGAEVSVR